MPLADDVSHNLRKAKKIVESTMKLKLAKVLFNEPVDPEALGIPNYFDVVKEPMDLGTIHERLAAGEEQDWHQCSYQSAGEVFRDVSLVWSNCVLFNNREVDKPTRDAALEVKAVFDTKWKEAGLAGASTTIVSQAVSTEGLVPEIAVTEAFGTAQEGVPVPLRCLDNFTVIRSATLEAADLISAWTSTLAVLGTVKPATTTKAKRQLEDLGMKTDSVTDWGFCYNAEPGVWVSTQLAWYKLVKPAEQYASLYEQLEHLLNLCSSAVKLLKHNSSLTPLAAAKAALAESGSDSGANEQWPGQIAFVEAQLSAWMEAAAGGARKGKSQSLSGVRLGKHGLTVSCTSAAAAATAAADSKSQQVGRSKKRKHKSPALNEMLPKKARKLSTAVGKNRKSLKDQSVSEEQQPHNNSNGSNSSDADNMQVSKPSSSFSSSASSAPSDSDSEQEAALQSARARRQRKGPAVLAVEALQAGKKSQKPKRGSSVQAGQLEQSVLPKRGKLVGSTRMKREREAQAARGPTPPPCRDFRLPQHQVPALLMVWEFTQMVASLLQLAPCPLWRLEAAIAPGPSIPAPSPSPGSPHPEDKPDPSLDKPADAEEPADPALGKAEAEVKEEEVKPSSKLQTRKQKAPKQVSAEVTEEEAADPAQEEGKAEAVKAAHEAPASPIDAAGSASAVLLRDIHCALLRAIEEKGLERDKPQPGQARLLSPDSAGPVPWTANVARVLLSAPITKASVPAKAAALKLAYMEYADLAVGERLALLQGLLEMALEVETIREYVSAKVEAMAPLSKREGREEARKARAAGTNPKELEVTAQPGSCEEWVGWMGACRVGCRKPLGYDAKRRRYWAFGGGLGAWRVYVEEQEGALWGWYEGESLSRLVEWLKAGSIEREAGLLKALAQAPIPKKLPQEGSASEVSISTDPGEEGQLLSSSELEGRRPDGFKFIVAPVLRGEGNWPSVSMYGTMEQRMQHTLEVLLARLPFWLQGSHWMARHANVLQAIGAARTGSDFAKALLFVEGMLVEQQAMDPSWEKHIQAAWRSALKSCTESRQAIMYLASLQEHMVDNTDVLPRQGFSQMARNMRCQLYFPHPTDQVILLRTGVLHHINSYMRALGLTPPSDSLPLKQPTANGLPDQAGANGPGAASNGPAASAKGPMAANGDTLMADTVTLPGNSDALGAAQRTLTDAPNMLLDGSKQSDGSVSVRWQQNSEDDLRPVGEPAAAEDAGIAQQAARMVDWHGPIKPEDREGLLQAWQGLKATVEALPPVGQYAVASVAYRRSLVATHQEDAEAVLTGQQARRPVAWLLLRPPRTHHRGPLQVLALPISCDASMPDYIVKADVFDRGMKRHWHRSDRFRMFFATSYGHKAGGVYYKGTVTSVREQMPSGGMGVLSKGTYDPWEALEVEWDVGGDAEGMDRVSPWEIENDPEEEKRMLEEARKAEEAAARTARLEAKAAKARRVTEGFESDDDMAAEYAFDEEAEHEVAAAQPGKATSSIAAAAAKAMEPALPAMDSEAYLEEEEALSLGEGALQPLEVEYEQPPLTAGGTVTKEVLELLGSLDKESFVRLLINWYRRAKGRYKVPTFAHQELDLHKVFWEVQDKGGYDQVTNLKLWKEICRSLHLDLTGQTSASYNMRLNYEKCLLDFERYLASGRYNADLAVGTAPPSDVLEAPPAVRPGQGGFAAVASEPHQSGYSTRGASRMAAGLPPSSISADLLEGSLSFTQLLNMDLDALEEEEEEEEEPPPKPATAGRSGGHAGPDGIAEVPTRPRTRRGVPPAAAAPASSLPSPAARTVQASQGGLLPLGHVLHNMARSLIGKKVMRNWPDNGGWWEANVVGYGPTSGQHKLKYDEGEDEESIEWVDFRELTVDEIKQHPAHPVVQRPPAAPRPAPPAAPTPVPGARQTSGRHASAEQAVASTITAALQAGVSAHALHKMIDAAAASLQRTAAATAAAKANLANHGPVVAPVAHVGEDRHQMPAHQQLLQSAQKQKPVKAASASTQILHAPLASQPAALPANAAAAASSMAPSPGQAEFDAPYSFRRHRRSDLVGRQSVGTPSDIQRPGPKARIRMKPSAVPDELPAEQDTQHDQAQHAKQEAADTQEAQDSTRTSIRIRLKRSGSGSRPGETSRAVNSKPLRHAKQEPSRSQTSAQPASQGLMSDPELVDEVPLLAGPGLASHDHLAAVNSHNGNLEPEGNMLTQPQQLETIAHDMDVGGDVQLFRPEDDAHDHPGNMMAADNNAEGNAVDTSAPSHQESEMRGQDMHDELSMGNTDMEMLSDIDLHDALGIDV